MNRKITFPELVDALSEVNGNSKKINESLLKDFFALIQENLERGETVKIKKLGVFKVVKVEARKSINVNTGKEIEIPEHFKVNFAPDKELADEVNAAFADFETIEIDDDISEEEINNDTENITVPLIEEISEPQQAEEVTEEDYNTEKQSSEIETEKVEQEIEETEKAVQPEEIEVEETDSNTTEELPEEIKEDTEEALAEPEEIQNSESENTDKENDTINKTDESKDLVSEENTSSNNYSDSNATVELSYDDEPGEKTEKGKNNFYKGFFCGVLFATIVVLVSIYLFSVFAGFKITITNDSETTATPTDNISIESEKQKQPIDTITADTIAAEIPVKNEVVLDTISRRRFLTTMAREYYGNFNFWVYIYEENNGILKNPDKIKLGTVVVIPPVSKYNIDKDNPKSIEDAKRKAVEIYSKYK